MTKTIPLHAYWITCVALVLLFALLRIESAIAVNHYNNDLTSQLFGAIESGNAGLVANLLKSGADPSSRNLDGCPALFRACETGETPEGYHPFKTVQLLVQYGADVNAADTDTGETPLMVAAGSNDVAAIKLLLKHGSKINTKDKTGNTALMFACKASSDSDEMLKVVAAKYLLYRGANLNAVNNDGDTVLMQMAWNGGYPVGSKYEASALAIAHDMLRHEAKTDNRDKSGKTALELAKADSFFAFVDLLQSRSH